MLVAPLDWGLGHATRCIPVVNALINLGCTVVIACDGAQKVLLEQEFPGLQFLQLKGYDVRYSSKSSLLALKILQQVPKILSAIKYEHAWLDKVIDEHKIDMVISENRYGLHSKKIPCIFITHQLTIKASVKWIEDLMRKKNYKYIERFTECWVPDIAGERNIAGELSHPKTLPRVPVKYIGPLSTFGKSISPGTRYKYVILLSGPEPQRTLLEEIVLRDLNGIKETCLVVRGKPADGEYPMSIAVSNVTIKNHLSRRELNAVINTAEYVICRSGYTSVMEILLLQKKAILIPTPGQTEQEYLAEHLMQQQWCLSVDQKNFNLSKAIEEADQFPYTSPPPFVSNPGTTIHERLSHSFAAR